MHSLDSLDLALELNKKLKIKNKIMNCLLQINSSKEDSKSGILPESGLDTFNKITKTCSNINLKGIMCIGPNSSNKGKIKKSFIEAYNIFKLCKNATICSMGMSSDFELAIQCGSNMVRLGSSLFKENSIC
jgi:pyridoxal phosphate enzyme (YggS family)